MEKREEMPVLPWATTAVRANITFSRHKAARLWVCKQRLCIMRQLIALEAATMKSPFLKHE